MRTTTCSARSSTPPLGSGVNKAESAAAAIADLNPDVNTRIWKEPLTEDNVDEVFEDFDVVLDATDNFATRYLINSAAVKRGIPSIYGSIYRFEGYASVFWPAQGGAVLPLHAPRAPAARAGPHLR